MINIKREVIVQKESTENKVSRILKNHLFYTYAVTGNSLLFYGPGDTSARLDVDGTYAYLGIFNVSDEVFKKICNDFITEKTIDMDITLHRIDIVTES
jgi:hypothetical protein